MAEEKRKMAGLENQPHADIGPTMLEHISVANTDPKMNSIALEAAAATDAEHNLSFWKALTLYPHAVGWSVLLSTAIVMEGFDVVLLGNLYAYPPFQRKFGELLPNGEYQLTAAWQSGLSNGAQVGEILGLFINGIIAEHYGYRKTMIGALSMVICFVFIVFFAQSLPQLLVGEILLGIPWGVFQTITTTYASEVCPIHLRAYLTTYVNICWVLGQFIASGVLKAMLTRTDEWGYRIPFALQWMWPVPLIVGIYLAPESPWWLVRKDRREEAKNALRRLTSRKGEEASSFNLDETISMMVHTNELERQASAGTSYWDLFKGPVALRRTEVVCMAWSIQQLCGSSLQAYSTYFYEQAGMATENAFTMTMVMYAIGALGTIFSWFLMGGFGRRTLYFWGQIAMVVCLVVIGCVSFAGSDNTSAQWAIGSLLVIITFIYDSSVGPVCYSLVAELTPTRLRTKGVVLARNVYNIVGIIANVLTPRMLNPSAWNWGAKAGFFWGASCLLCAIWTFWRLPEPKDRSYAELDILFERRVPARKFKSTKVDSFDGTVQEIENAGANDTKELH